MPKSTGKRPTGRPRVEMNWEEFEKLCEIQCTLEEIAHWFRCSVDTILRSTERQYNDSFANVREQKAVRGRAAIRRGLFQLGLKGNLGALIWLSKNHLGMADKLEQKTSADIALSQVPTETLMKLVQDTQTRLESEKVVGDGK